MYVWYMCGCPHFNENIAVNSRGDVEEVFVRITSRAHFIKNHLMTIQSSFPVKK